MTTKQEFVILKEIGRIYQDCSERVATYTRWRWVTLATGWILIFIAFGASQILNGALCLVIALLGGFTVGLSLLFSASAKQIPILVRYTALRDGDMQKRLEELNKI